MSAFRVLALLVLLSVSLLIGCWNVHGSGALWPDAPQYANAGAMVRDWLFSGELLHPYNFAARNYARYPAFHMPYHPPAYPVLLGLFFSITGVSYGSARLFVALCLFVAGVFFLAFLRRTGCNRAGALAGALLLITMPQVAYWSRDTMSEIPGLALILAGSYFFLTWIQTDRVSAYFVAFCFAEAAFLSRHLAGGVLRAWFLWAVLAGKTRALLRPKMLIAPVVFAVISASYVAFSLPYSKFEVGYGAPTPNRNYAAAVSWRVLSFYVTHAPAVAGWFTLAAAVAGLVYLCYRRRSALEILLWPSWLLSYLLFVLAVGIYGEDRYGIYGAVAFAGLAAAVVSAGSNSLARTFRYVGASLVIAALAANVVALRAIPKGVTGNERVADRLASMQEPGNVLISTPLDSDAIFRYRSNDASARRTFIRADRTLAIRPPSYTDTPTQIVATTNADILNIIRKGRVRFVVTTTPQDSHAGQSHDAVLLDKTVRSLSLQFTRVDAFDVHFPYVEPVQVCIWRFNGELPPGDSEIPVVIPTADMTITGAQ
jgi:4-amino-4-deoxy-L-arabinose transferase-like glycosyltransferase